MAKLTTEEFIKRSRIKHGNKFDYSKSNYINYNTKVIITCPIHGQFEQTPDNHVRCKTGCNQCGGIITSVKRTTGILGFVKLSRCVHGEKYNYNKFIYVNNNKPGIIICPIHGEFKKSPADHITKKRGCLKCNAGAGYRAKLNTKEFIEKCKKKHGDRYDYSLVVYANRKTKIKIKCKIHGLYEQRAGDHQHGKGCPKCNGGIKHSLDSFINESIVMHGHRYDYSMVDYKNVDTAIQIVCHTHGIFEQTPWVHKKGHGCPSCSGVKKLTLSEVLNDFKKVHGNKYDYSKFEYTQAKQLGIIICKLHGEFEQSATVHKKGHGCPSCAHIISKQENELSNKISKFYSGVILRNDRKIIKPYELDIVLPDLKLAIEYCGLRWHSEMFGGKDKHYHLMKLEQCNAKGYDLITIFEDEFINDNTGTLRRLRNHINPVNYDEVAIVYSETESKITITALSGGGPIGIMIFSTKRLEITKCIGSMKIIESMFDSLIENYSLSKVNLTLNRCWSACIDYKKLGFVIKSITPPACSYILPHEITRYKNKISNDYDKIWDCGSINCIWTQTGLMPN